MTKFSIKQPKRKIKEIAKQKVSPVFFYMVMALIVIVGMSYLIFVNTVATDGYQVKELSEKIEDLEYNNKKLDLEISKLHSMSSVSDVSENLQLVSVSKMDYIEAGSTGVVAYK